MLGIFSNVEEFLLFLLLFLVNLAISWWNSYAVGSSWVEMKYAGGGRRFMAWMGAIMSACGFTWCYLIVIGVILGATHVVTRPELQFYFSLGYLILIPFVLFAGWAITISSWRRAYHERSAANLGVAGWNSFASAYNTYNAVRGIGPALKSVFDGITKAAPKSGNAAGYYWMIVAALFAASLGVVTTALLIHHYAGREDLSKVGRRAGVSEYATDSGS